MGHWGMRFYSNVVIYKSTCTVIFEGWSKQKKIKSASRIDDWMKRLNYWLLLPLPMQP